jgi:glucan phosphoethanolaminetransferase (alkaline phosphatase superfamily)
MTNQNNQAKGIGTVLITLGLLFLFLQTTNVAVGWFAWPFFIILPGVLLLAVAFMSGKAAAGLAIPGSIVTMIGLILFTQNVTGRFETWSYAWALIPTAVGISIFMQGSLTHNEKLRTDGSRLALIGLALLFVFGAFFELFIFNRLANSFIWRYGLPMLSIGGGAYLLVRRKAPMEPTETPIKPPDTPQTPPTPQA